MGTTRSTSRQSDTLGGSSAEEGVGHVAGRDGDFDAAFFEDGDLRDGDVLGIADDRAGVAHAAARGRGGSGDEAGDGFRAIGLDPARGLDLGETPRPARETRALPGS